MPKTQYERQKPSIDRYLSKLTRIQIWVTPEIKQKLTEQAKQSNMSLTEYILSKTETPLP